MNMVLRDILTSAVETRILNLQNQQTKINKNSLETGHKTEEMKLKVKNY